MDNFDYIDDTINEASYPGLQFGYVNYKHDPVPRVLILGTGVNKNKNEIIAGININYLDDVQLDNLRTIVDKVYKFKPKLRYDVLKKIAPDIAKYYRTYDTDFVVKVKRKDFHSVAKQIVDKRKKAEIARRREKLAKRGLKLKRHSKRWPRQSDIDTYESIYRREHYIGEILEDNDVNIVYDTRTEDIYIDDKPHAAIVAESGINFSNSVNIIVDNGKISCESDIEVCEAYIVCDFISRGGINFVLASYR